MKNKKVIIVGGGVIGASVAYHLAEAGFEPPLLLERKELTCGTTWHAAGLVAQLRPTPGMTALAKYSAELYRRLGEETGYRQKGALNIADSDGLFMEYRRAASLAKRLNLPAEVLSPAQIKERAPQLNTDGIVGGVWLPSDGQIDPTGLTRALANGAKQNGARIVEHCRVRRVLTEDGRAVGVETEKDGKTEEIAADVVVLAAGLWTRQLAADAGACAPLYACEHYYLVTEPMPDIPADMPVIRDVGARAYYKEDAGKILLGCFEEKAVPWGENIPEDFSFDSLPGDWEHFSPIMEKAMERLPVLQTAGVKLFFCGPESFTPDDRYLLGETPEIKNLFVAAGMNSIGIQSAGGVGKALAAWIAEGMPPSDLGDVDIARAMPFMRNKNYLRERVQESLGVLYDVHWPYRQMTTARGARRGALHGELQKAGACFGELAGWERANWFAPNETNPQYEYAYGRQNWFARCGEECLAAQNAAVVVDLSSFAKFIVRGADACALLNRISANNVDVAVGKIVYTPWLNKRGGFEADLTVTRLAEDSFLVLSGAMSQTRDMARLLRCRLPNEKAEVFDATSAYALIGVFGPKAADVLQNCGANGFNSIPYGEARRVEVGYALPLALRIGYCGEAGAELLVETEFAVNVYLALMEAGKEFGIKNIGMHAVDSMRMEKARRHFGDDITTEDTPLEAGLGFAVAWGKSDFIGRECLLQQKDKVKTKRLLHFSLSSGADAPLMFGEEPLLRNGEIVGGVTSAAYGHRIGKSLALAYAHNDADAGGVTNEWVEGGEWEIEIAGKRKAATWHKTPPYDPQNKALKLRGE